MKTALHFAAAARLWFVPLVGAAALASACNAAAAPSPGTPSHAVSASRAAANARATNRCIPIHGGRAIARTAAPRSAASGAAAGLVIGIDPESGAMGPASPEQMARLSAARGARAMGSTTRSAPIRRADGRVTMYVGNWMREVSVVRLGADGRPVLDCVDGHDAAVRLRHSSPAPAGTEER